ncbi:unnamed protein product [Tuber aestivum]|uniref:Uncharacterized protein n=1 Tax=Tuber aestivum TaxID=59557 RepID=A0A292PTX4_9PEZI|nr:unnamed protein product [Tuber aestivum]
MYGNTSEASAMIWNTHTNSFSALTHSRFSFLPSFLPHSPIPFLSNARQIDSLALIRQRTSTATEINPNIPSFARDERRKIYSHKKPKTLGRGRILSVFRCESFRIRNKKNNNNNKMKNTFLAGRREKGGTSPRPVD